MRTSSRWRHGWVASSLPDRGNSWLPATENLGPISNHNSMRTLKLALIGMGTVGTGVAKILVEQAAYLRSRCGADLQIKWVVVRDPSKHRAFTIPGAEITTDLDRVVEDPEIEIAIEVMGTVRPAFEMLCALMLAGKNVVTANKAVLAEHGAELFALARECGRTVCFEAAVAGGVPIIAAVGERLLANRILYLAGILNGTSNFILSAMHDRKVGYAEALSEAQQKGFAEADPTLDVDGTDAAQKLAILARLAFQSAVDSRRIRKAGINGLADADIQYAIELGYAIKLLAIAQVEEGVLHLRVAPTLVHQNHPLGQVRGEYNAIQVVGDAVGDTLYFGKGAGMMPTASSVVAGVLDLVIGRGQETFASLKLWEKEPPGPRFLPEAFLRSRFYLRFTIVDQPGTLACIAGILGDHGIGIASVIQHETGEDRIGAAVPLIIMTHVADEGAVRDALKVTDGLEIVQASSVCLHVSD